MNESTEFIKIKIKIKKINVIIVFIQYISPSLDYIQYLAIKKEKKKKKLNKISVFKRQTFRWHRHVVDIVEIDTRNDATDRFQPIYVTHSSKIPLK